MSEDAVFSVVIATRAWRFDAPASQTLLLSSSCRNGTCRTCICKMLSGQVHYRIEWPGLSPDEKREGAILPCVAYPDSDIMLDNVAARRA
jgi:ferredoxin